MSTSQMKKGDRIKVVKTWDGRFQGCEGTILEAQGTNSEGEECYLVSLDNSNPKMPTQFGGEELELLEEAREVKE